MLSTRALRLPEDEVGILKLDTSFETDRVYTVKFTENSVLLIESSLDYKKQYQLPLEELARLTAQHFAVVAVIEESIVGLAAAEYLEWNRRVVIHHLYVSRAHRSAGIGKLLLEDVTIWSRSRAARCLWLETQNVNYPAIQFYKNCGFKICGLDTSLYNPAFVDPLEVGVFFSKSIK